MLAVIFNALHQRSQSCSRLRIGVVFIRNTRRTHINLQLQTMKRMPPRQHLRIYESLRAADTEPGDVNVMIDQSFTIYIVERTLYQVRRLRAEPGIQFFRLFCEGAANGVNETHLLRQTYHRAEHRCHEFTLFFVVLVVNSKHISANNSERLSGSDDFSHRQKLFTFGRSQKIDFEFNTQDFRVRRHQTVSRVATG